MPQATAKPQSVQDSEAWSAVPPETTLQALAELSLEIEKGNTDHVSATGEGEPIPNLQASDVEPLPAQESAATGAGSGSSTADEPTGALRQADIARKRVPVIALDPGHGGPESGASAGDFAEKTVNLKIALKLAALLHDVGYQAVLTRDSDRAVSPEYTGGGSYPGVSRDLQARIDIANGANADLFISIHNNGSGDASQSGTEVWYDSLRSFGERNMALAKLAQASLVRQIRALGYPVYDRGIKDDRNFRIFQGRAYQIYVLSPGDGPRAHVPTKMPGVLGESLFLSHAGDAAMLRREVTLDAIAAGYRDAIVAYFDHYPLEPTSPLD